jgi:hypothetical protein
VDRREHFVGTGVSSFNKVHEWAHFLRPLEGSQTSYPTMLSTSPPTKRIKLESSPESSDWEAYKPELPPEEEDLDEEHCSICLQPLSDRTVLPACSHEFCFDCILIWTGSCQYSFHFRWSRQ